MRKEDKDLIIERYNKRLNKFGPTIEALASGNEERHKMRFDVSTKVGITEGDTVLDLGCGFGDYYEYLKEIGLEVDYAGYDINPNLISEAKKRFPGVIFETKDIINEEFPEFDYIISSSCFNLPLQNESNYEFVEQLFERCYKNSRKGVAIDFNSTYVDFFSKEGFHYEPERLFALAKKFTKRVTLRHDYPLFEFCIYMYKDFKGWSK